jgi:hypothetical protein
LAAIKNLEALSIHKILKAGVFYVLMAFTVMRVKGVFCEADISEREACSAGMYYMQFFSNGKHRPSILPSSVGIWDHLVGCNPFQSN